MRLAFSVVAACASAGVAACSAFALNDVAAARDASVDGGGGSDGAPDATVDATGDAPGDGAADAGGDGYYTFSCPGAGRCLLGFEVCCESDAGPPYAVTCVSAKGGGCVPQWALECLSSSDCGKLDPAATECCIHGGGPGHFYSKCTQPGDAGPCASSRVACDPSQSNQPQCPGGMTCQPIGSLTGVGQCG